jgi:hypothetical protein
VADAAISTDGRVISVGLGPIRVTAQVEMLELLRVAAGRAAWVVTERETTFAEGYDDE